MYASIHLCMYACIHSYMQECIYVCMHALLFVCLGVSFYVCVCACDHLEALHGTTVVIYCTRANKKISTLLLSPSSYLCEKENVDNCEQHLTHRRHIHLDRVTLVYN